MEHGKLIPSISKELFLAFVGKKMSSIIRGMKRMCCALASGGCILVLPPTMLAPRIVPILVHHATVNVYGEYQITSNILFNGYVFLTVQLFL